MVEFNKRLLPAAIAVALAGVYGMPSAFAQQNDEAETEEEAADLDRIVVTGSRIRSIDMVTTQPVTTIDSDYLTERGQVNVQDAVTDIPGVSAAASPILPSNTAAAGQGLGQRTINLFGLGSQRTLTLVNGSRFVSSNSPVGGASAPGGQLDVNNIPVGLVERIEVMNVGGSAIYGADAVAGVVNYILKDDYEGMELAADYRFIGEDIGNEVSIRGLLGGNFDNNRGNLVFGIEYNEMDNIPARDVPSFANTYSSFTPVGDDMVPDPETGEVPGNQVRLYPDPRAGILSFTGIIAPGPLAITNVGLGIWPDGQFRQFDGQGGIIPYDPGTPTGNQVWGSGGDGLDLEATNTAQEGYERWNVVSIGHYDINDHVRATTQVFANRYFAENPGYQAQLYSSGAFGGMSAALQFPLDHPFLPQAARDELEGVMPVDEDGNAQDFFYLHRGWTNLGAREVTNESNTFSSRVGLEGEFELADRDWFWEVGYQYGESGISSSSTGVNDWRWLAAMDVATNPETGQIDCRFNFEEGYGEELRPRGMGIAAADMPLGNPGDCVPFNPFGEVSEEAKDYISYSTGGRTRIEQEVYSAFIGGDLFELPAGMLAFAGGVEHRTEFASFTASPVASLKGLSDNSLAGGYDTTDVYGEFLAPLVSPDMEIPFLNALTFEGSYRAIDNSLAGTDDTWAIGLNYRPIEDVMIRANMQETVRAPAVTELFLPVVESSQFANDPCDGRFRGSGPDPATRQANCDAEGIPADFVSIAPNASRRGFSGGNLDLENEQAESYNIGIAYSPSFIPGLLLQVDYIEIDIEDAIVSFSLNDIMEACYDSTDFPNQFCDMFDRGPDFQVPTTDAFTSGYVNAAMREFRAVSYDIRYDTDVNDLPGLGGLFGDTYAGRLHVNLRAYNQKKNATSNTGFDFSDITGQHNSPDWRGDLRLRHTLGDLTTLLDISYHGRGRRDNFQTSDVQYLDQDGNPYTHIPSQTRANLAVNYTLPTGTVLRARVTNLFDKLPGPLERGVARWEFGRSYNIGLTHRF
ncbi:TonB-dependent receptor [Wenzhouxiangella sp. AB-CW3]|uniref:TonB-dependent receptor domain-containing protein n=1 Tax=Wenzhouxiangella sp. AB-CW3 TaxID=2771012 RepID=UPI00168ABE8F|nr:TonB-dependent receptor [Wenzhouxiangella sp. AB-CW3]QOC22834.1 TonB-dependent receptor [Wenzhouxiangella sp. AB-CW3]